MDLLTILIPAAALLIVIACFELFRKGHPHTSLHTGYPVHAYTVRPDLFTKSEAALFLMLRRRLPGSFHIFPKMRIADVLYTTHGNGYYKRRNQILAKHIDFVVCDMHFKPLVAIELDGKSHRRQDRVERDELVNEICAHAGLKLVRIPVGTHFSSAVTQILSEIQPARRTVTPTQI